MSRSSGAGFPLHFRCASCRSMRRDGMGWSTSVTLTGRTRKIRSTYCSRSTDTRREYRCACGHVGWSRHIDLARKGLTR